jgi:O-antigen/teichoic acid export membrane protein
LTKSEIRLQYSGFIIFAARILSVATGLAFALMLTRSTTEPELGIWGNVNDMLAYFVFLAPAFPFWAMRFAARNKEGSIRTGIFANLMISMIAILIYLSVISLILPALSISTAYLILYFIASAEIIETYLMIAMESCLRAKMPQTIGYGLLIEESCKVLLAYVLIIKLQQPLIGALVSLTAAIAIQIVYYLRLLYNDLKQPVRWDYVKEWLKGSTINIYYYIGDRIAAFTFIILIAYDPTAGQAARGIYQVALIIANIIGYSSFLSFALYPKLLAESNIQDVTTSLKTVLMFALPMMAGAIVLSDSYLAILNEIYREVAPVLIVLAINIFVQIISQFYSSVLFGLEKIDEKAKIPLRKLVKSPVFKAFTLPYVHSAMALPTTFYVLTNFAKNQPITAAIYVGIIDTIVRLITFLILYIIIRKMVKLRIPWKNIAKYAFASAIMAIVLFLVPHPERLYLTLGVTLMGAIFYLILLMTIDKEARALFKSFWQEIKSKVGGEV